MTELQPSTIQINLSKTAIALLLATLCHKRAGILSIEMNEDLHPKSCSIKAKLDTPKEVANNEETLAYVKEWNEFMEATRKEMKKCVIAQSTHTVNFLHESCLELFSNHLVNITKGYITYHRELKTSNNKPLSNHAYSAVVVYCYFSTLSATNKLFGHYLHKDQDVHMESFKKAHM
jgi:hypothetical protein